MDELIKKQDAIDALGERPLAWTQDEYLRGLQNQYDSDVEAIQSVLSASQWILCSERLPEEDSFYNTHGYKKSSKYVLVTVLLYENRFGFSKIVRVGRYDYKYKKWAVLSCPQWREIIAWMPMPTPYKESEE